VSTNNKLRFRVLLPIAQAIGAAGFLGIGLWLRHRILDQRFFGTETLWASTAVYHVWPWPFKVAVITNLPAFFATAFVSIPLSALWPSASSRVYECIDLVVMLLCVVILWYLVGRRMDHWAMTTSTARCWIVLAIFTASTMIGIFVPGHVGYVPYGLVLWLCFIYILRTRRPSPENFRSTKADGVRP
jgi:hypothetical protein